MNYLWPDDFVVEFANLLIIELWLFSSCITIPDNCALDEYFVLSRKSLEHVFAVKYMLKCVDVKHRAQQLC